MKCHNWSVQLSAVSCLTEMHYNSAHDTGFSNLSSAVLLPGDILRFSCLKNNEMEVGKEVRTWQGYFLMDCVSSFVSLSTKKPPSFHRDCLGWVYLAPQDMFMLWQGQYWAVLARVTWGYQQCSTDPFTGQVDFNQQWPEWHMKCGVLALPKQMCSSSQEIWSQQQSQPLH